MDKDVTKKVYFSDNERYADLINGLLCGGIQKIKATDLQELDTQSHLFIWGKKRSNRYCPQYRDLLRRTAFGVNFALIGIENQEQTHYLMALRTMLYDAAEYKKQAARIQKQVRKLKHITSAEFLSGFRKTDHLFPCITIVLHYGGKWDAGKSLHDILDFTDIPVEFRKYINDYPLHIFDVSTLENMDVFHTDIKQIFNFIKYSKDKKKLKELVANDKVYQELDEDAYDMITTCTNAEKLIEVKKFHKEGGKVNMCQALNEMLEDERQIGIELGITQGITQGIEHGIKAFILDNLEEGVLETRIAEKLIQRFQLTPQKANEYIRKYH